MNSSPRKRSSIVDRELDKRKRTRSRTWSENATVDEDAIAVGSRKSNLALIQTKQIMNMLQQKQQNINLRLVTMETLGDKILNIALPKIGEKSLFTKDLELALASKRVQFLVHSLKDLPTTLPPDMAIGAIIQRDNPYDCVLFHTKHKGKTLADLPDNSVIGTSSLRRIAQLKRHYKHLQFQSIRGNLNTRLKKLEEENGYDAIVLAKAGVDRMGWVDKVGQMLTEEQCLYAIGQGAIAVEIRKDDKEMQHLIGELTHMDTLLTCACERAFMRKLNGGCSTPVACVTLLEGMTLTLRGVVLNNDGSTCLDKTLTTNITTPLSPTIHTTSTSTDQHAVGTTDRKDTASSSASGGKTYTVSSSGIVIDSLFLDQLEKAEELGEKLAVELIELGADKILAEVRANIPKVMNIQIPSKPKTLC